ncbi:MAG: PAS domain S-box protein [Bacteroidales bacterium]|nr:PAS domain S-box protein [Bacteroidales bacterium]
MPKLIKHIVLFLSIGIFCAETLNAFPYYYEHLSVEDGLSQNSVNTILQDKAGFIWLGTNNGLNRYNGYDFEHFLPDVLDSNKISNNVISYLHEDREGFLWIATEFGLNRFDRITETFTRFLSVEENSNTMSSNIISAICEDSEGAIWIGTKNGGLNRYNKKTQDFTRFSYLTDSNYTIYTMHQDILNPDIFWIGTQNGLFTFNKESLLFEPVDAVVKLQNGMEFPPSIQDIIQGTDGTLYIGTWSLGLFKYTKDQRILAKISLGNSIQSSNPITIRSLLVDGNDLWAGTKENGLYKINLQTESVNHYTNIDNEQITDYSIISLYKDLAGIIWVGTNLNGFFKLNNKIKSFNTLTPNSDSKLRLNSRIVTTIFEDSKNNLWIGTRENGLNKISNNKKHISYINTNSPVGYSLNMNYIHSIIETTENGIPYLWVSTDGGGINKINLLNNKISIIQTKFSTPGSISNNYIYALKSYDKNHMLIGSWGVSNQGGLDILNISTNKSVNLKNDIKNINSLSTNIVLCIFIDKSGMVWLGTKGGGLNRFTVKNIDAKIPEDIGTFKRFQHDPYNPQSINNNDVYCIYEDRNGVFWIGTGGGGLNKFDRTKEIFKHYTTEDGLLDNIIYGILEDDHNNLWISTGKGIAVFNPKSEEFRSYNRIDGLSNNVFIQGASYKSKNGTMYFGGINGCTYFHPDSIVTDTTTCKIVLTKFIIHSTDEEFDAKSITKKSLSCIKEIELKHKMNDIYLEFTSLDYFNSQRIKYRYKLEGYDTDWKLTQTSRRFATYSNLPNGHYIFRIQGNNADGFWAKETELIKIYIRPPFWKSWWFISILSGILLLFLAFLFMYFKNKWTKEKEELEKRVLDSTHEERNLLRTLIDNMPDSIYIKDRESRFIVGNKRVAKVMGASSPDELIGKTDFDFYPYDLANPYYLDEQDIMRTGEAIIGKYEPGIDEDGNRTDVSTTKVPLKGQDGEIIGIIGIGRDITKFKNVEKELRKKSDILQETNVLLEERQEEIEEKSEELKAYAEDLERVNSELEKLNRTKDKFFSIIAHDLKNPFHAIIGFSEMLSNDFNEMDTQQKLGLIELINMSSESAYNLLENLLQWARTQTDKINYTPDSIDLFDVVKNVIKFHKVSAEKKRIKLRSDIKPNTYAYADMNMINTVVRNLISNAIKFTNNEGNITVFVNELDGKFIEVCVSDSGVGIQKENLEKLFRIDTYYSTSGTSGETGTGLGLIICKEFIEKNGGVLRAESNINKGSTFIFTLPKENLRKKQK